MGFRKTLKSLILKRHTPTFEKFYLNILYKYDGPNRRGETNSRKGI